jgi:prepilin-type N-terminal cleavage/methylation domain-containing protein
MRERGFTLIEILIVTALIGVLGAMTVPAIAAGMERYEVLSATQQVASTIRTARFQAVGKNMILHIRFNFPDDGDYQIVDDDDAAVGGVQILDDDITVSGDVDIEFTTSGRLNAASAQTVTVSNGDEEFDRTITVSTSGRVTID